MESTLDPEAFRQLLTVRAGDLDKHISSHRLQQLEEFCVRHPEYLVQNAATTKRAALQALTVHEGEGTHGRVIGKRWFL